MIEVMCGSQFPCGFRVHADYYRAKPRFVPGVCARCSGPIKIVERGTETQDTGHYMALVDDQGAGHEAGGIYRRERD